METENEFIPEYEWRHRTLTILSFAYIKIIPVFYLTKVPGDACTQATFSGAGWFRADAEVIYA